MYNIGIIGYGVVGQAVAAGFENGTNTIKKYDKFKDLDSFEDTVKYSDYLFVCLPTPYKGDRIDPSIIDEVIENMAKLTAGTNKTIIIKSTITPGTTQKYIKTYPDSNFCFSPEFLTEKSPAEDFKNPDRIVIGTSTEEVADKVGKLYRSIISKAPIFKTDPTSAEIVKYMANCILATKIVFANEIYDLCEKMGAKYNEVKDMVMADKRVGSHIEVTEERGFGGKCFPKDTIALIGTFKDLGLDCTLLEAMWKKNLKIRKKHDWEEIPFVNSKE